MENHFRYRGAMMVYFLVLSAVIYLNGWKIEIKTNLFIIVLGMKMMELRQRISALVAISSQFAMIQLWMGLSLAPGPFGGSSGLVDG